MSFNVNEKLKRSVIDSVPKRFTNRQKVLYVYKTLCEKLDYSLMYYVDTAWCEHWYTDPKNLETIDGESRNDVVCYTFVAILSEILKELNLENVEVEEIEINKDGRFDDDHAQLYVRIDGNEYCLDSTTGILERNDLVEIKHGDDFHGVQLVSVCKSSNRGKLIQGLNKDCLMVSSYKNKLHELAYRYRDLKGNDYQELDLNQRYNLFCKMLEEIDEKPSLMLLNYIIKIKRLLIRENEDSTNFELRFVHDIGRGEERVLTFFNPNGRTDDKTIDDIIIKDYNLRTHKFSAVEVDEVLKMINNPYEFAVDVGVPYLFKDFKMISNFFESRKNKCDADEEEPK